MLRNVRCIVSSLAESNVTKINKRILQFNHISAVQCRWKKTNPASISSLFKPVDVKPTADENNIGFELTGSTIDKNSVTRILNRFVQLNEIRMLCLENGIDALLQQQAFASFRRFCRDPETLPTDLQIVFSDIHNDAGHVADIFPYFLQHAKQIFPHLDCMDDLKKISDLREPANWYPSARALNRKIVFHAGPTNSGKTYHAMERFLKAKSGIYCGPLKLLATEVYHKSNQRGTPCDLVTGEERSFAIDGDHPSSHVACTVEMTSLTTPYEVAIIDEIQQIKDPQRGWAWTRALLGLVADEIHVCGEPGAIDLIKRLCETMSEDVEVRNYERLTKLTVESKALTSLSNVRPGDCIVCFSKNDIYTISKKIESLGKEVAVIYGTLPPGTKLAQAAKFNDPTNSCKIMVATDAIGMGLNLSIRRIIFYSLIKTTMNEKGDREQDIISVSSALQIAGRAGRFGTQWEEGYVTTFKSDDLPKLKEILSQTPEPLVKAGLHPTADQIELYAYHLPNSTLSNLMDIFVTLSTLDDFLYFICNTEDFKFLAEMIQHVPLPLKARYVFCCAPINKKMPFVCSMFLKIARQFSKGEPITFNWLCTQVSWPFTMPKTIGELVHLESVFDVLDLYLWLSYRFVDVFPEANLVRDIQKDLDEIIQQGVIQITKLLQNSDSVVSSGSPNDDPHLQRNERDLKLASVPLKGRLTERLLAQGLLTPSMLQELRKEWDRASSVENEESDDERNKYSPFSKKHHLPRRLMNNRKKKF